MLSTKHLAQCFQDRKFIEIINIYLTINSVQVKIYPRSNRKLTVYDNMVYCNICEYLSNRISSQNIRSLGLENVYDVPLSSRLAHNTCISITYIFKHVSVGEKLLIQSIWVNVLDTLGFISLA